VNPDHTIAEFEEKPPVPRSNKASMGVYVFSWQKLRQYLIDDEADPASQNDFGKNVIPAMHGAGEKLVAYPFGGYWKDVGTIGSLWDANLDILNPKIDLDLNDSSWKIYSNSPALPPQYISETAAVQNAMITEGCDIGGDVDYSVLFANVTVEEGAEVRYSIVMPGTTIKRGAVVQYAIVAENAEIAENAVVGEQPEDKRDGEWGVAVVGAGVRIGRGAQAKANTMTDEDMEDCI
jgi:glucose-1-phosphate adenylyltransferase